MTSTSLWKALPSLLYEYFKKHCQADYGQQLPDDLDLFVKAVVVSYKHGLEFAQNGVSFLQLMFDKPDSRPYGHILLKEHHIQLLIPLFKKKLLKHK